MRPERSARDSSSRDMHRVEKRDGTDTGLPILSRFCCALNGHKTVEFMLAGTWAFGFRILCLYFLKCTK